MATAKKTTEAADEPEAVEQLPAGIVVRHADNDERLGLLAGYDDEGFPLVVDLPPARAHHPGVVRA